jgi:phenylpyruvate tautomerase PptA (4-oxalocrotonate tautomerase family)
MARYVVQVPREALSDERKAKIAEAVTSAHRKVTGEDPEFVQVAITEIDAGCFFAGGRLIECDHIFVHGYVDDATTERRGSLSKGISAAVTEAADFEPDSTWTTISEL